MENQIVCANCNSINSAKNLFCQNCGKPLTAARPATPVQPVQPVKPVAEPPITPVTGVPTPPSFQPVGVPPTTAPQYPPVLPVYPQPSAPIQAVRPEAPPPAQQPQYPPVQPGYVQPTTGIGKSLPVAAKPLGVKINHLGIVIDAWADVIENGAEKGAAVSEEFDRLMEEHKIPDVVVTRKEMTVDGEPVGRTFHLLQNSRGGSMLVNFGAQGKDLLISWDAYTKPVLNLIYVAILLGGTAAVTLIITLISGILGVNFISFLFSWVNRFYNWLFPVIVGAALAGFLLKGNCLAFFIKQPNKFSQDDLTGLMLIGHQTILKAVESAGLDAKKLHIKKGLHGGSWFRRI